MTNLDKFLNTEDTNLKYTINGKTIIGDVSTLTMLKLTKFQDVDNEAKQTELMFEVIFGKENADYIFKSLKIAGIMAIANDITNKFGVETNEKK